MMDDLRSVKYGRKPTDDEVKQFNKMYPNPTTRRYSPWCDDRNINQALLKDMLDRLPRQRRKVKTNLKSGSVGNSRRRDFYKAEVLDVLDIQGWTCNCCMVKLSKKTACGDHIIPYSRGGVTEMWNLQVLCPDCNSKKRSKDPLVWAYTMGITFSDEFISKYYEGVIDSSHSPRIWKY